MTAIIRRAPLRRVAHIAGVVFCLTLAVASVLMAPSSSARGQGAPLVGPIAVSGSGLVDRGAGGAPVTLRGVEFYVTSNGPYPGGFIDPDALSTLQAWGANFVRLEISSDEFLQECPNETYDWNYRSELSQAVEELTGSGIFVVLDIGHSNPDCLWGSGQGSGTVPLPGDDVQTTLGMLANLYGANPLVGYEPFNEPQACAMSATGAGASEFVPLDSESGDVCASEAQADLAWNEPGTVIAGATNFFGLLVGGRRYDAPGMAQLYQTIESNLPAGAPNPLVFMDANGWAGDASTFDGMAQPLNSATNLVEVFHPYDCQDYGSGSAMCNEADPEACSATAANVDRFLADPATGAAWGRPVVFDEFNFPAGERSYDYMGTGLLGSTRLPILMYQHGYWVNNTIAAMQSGGAAGWSLYYLQDADASDYQTPYSMTQPGVESDSPVPWTPNANAAPAVAAMQGTGLSCEAPPPGYG